MILGTSSIAADNYDGTPKYTVPNSLMCALLRTDKFATNQSVE